MSAAIIGYLKATQSQDELQVNPAFLQTEGHVTVAKDGQTDPCAKGCARKGTPKALRLEALDEGSSQRTISSTPKVLAMIKADKEQELPWTRQLLKLEPCRHTLQGNPGLQPRLDGRSRLEVLAIRLVERRSTCLHVSPWFRGLQVPIHQCAHWHQSGGGVPTQKEVGLPL